MMASKPWLSYHRRNASARAGTSTAGARILVTFRLRRLIIRHGRLQRFACEGCLSFSGGDCGIDRARRERRCGCPGLRSRRTSRRALLLLLNYRTLLESLPDVQRLLRLLTHLAFSLPLVRALGILLGLKLTVWNPGLGEDSAIR